MAQRVAWVFRPQFATQPPAPTLPCRRSIPLSHQGREAIAAKLSANIITEAGADRVLAMDLHSGQCVGYFDIPVDHVYGDSGALIHVACWLTEVARVSRRGPRLQQLGCVCSYMPYCSQLHAQLSVACAGGGWGSGRLLFCLHLPVPPACHHPILSRPTNTQPLPANCHPCLRACSHFGLPLLQAHFQRGPSGGEPRCGRRRSRPRLCQEAQRRAAGDC